MLFKVYVMINRRIEYFVLDFKFFRDRFAIDNDFSQPLKGFEPFRGYSLESNQHESLKIII